MSSIELKQRIQDHRIFLFEAALYTYLLQLAAGPACGATSDTTVSESSCDWDGHVVQDLAPHLHLWPVD